MSVLLHPFKRFGFYTMFSFNVRILLFCIFWVCNWKEKHIISKLQLNCILTALKSKPRVFAVLLIVGYETLALFCVCAGLQIFFRANLIDSCAWTLAKISSLMHSTRNRFFFPLLVWSTLNHEVTDCGAITHCRSIFHSLKTVCKWRYKCIGAEMKMWKPVAKIMRFRACLLPHIGFWLHVVIQAALVGVRGFFLILGIVVECCSH